MWRLGPRKLPHGLNIGMGSNWIVLNKEFVSYVVNGNDELINGLRTMYTHTLLPAESFFHTLVLNSKFCSSSVKTNLKLENWKTNLARRKSKKEVDWDGKSPNGKRSIKVSTYI